MKKMFAAAILIFKLTVALAQPVLELSFTDRWDLTWSETGSGSKLDGSVWSPKISSALHGSTFRFSHVVINGYGEGSSVAACTGDCRDDLTVEGTIGDYIWNDGGSYWTS